MSSVIEVFNTILEFLKMIIQGFTEFFNTIPILFQNIGDWSSQLFPADFTAYIIAFVSIVITLVIIRFVRG